jgi:hypothetical protein
MISLKVSGIVTYSASLLEKVTPLCALDLQQTGYVHQAKNEPRYTNPCIWISILVTVTTQN